VLVDRIENVTVFTYVPSAVLPRYVDLTLALPVRGYSQPLYFRDGTEMRNAAGS